MGLPKRATSPRCSPMPARRRALGGGAWRARERGRNQRDLRRQFIPLNAAVVGGLRRSRSRLLPVVATLRAAGLKIGSTTGYTRDIMARPDAARRRGGYQPDNLVCAGDLVAGRPTR